MRLRDKIISFFKMDDVKAAINTFSINDSNFISILREGEESTDGMGEITYNTCLRLMGESLSKLPLKMYKSTDIGLIKVTDHPAIKVLRNPNPYTRPSAFWSSIEMNRNHYGNAYVYIQRNPNGSVKHLWILPSKDVTVKYSQRGVFGQPDAIWYEYKDVQTGAEYRFHSDEIMHFKTSVSFDGIMGLPMREVLKTYLDNGKKSSDYLNNYYKSGMMGKTYLAFDEGMQISQEDAQAFAQTMAKYSGGVANSTKIPVVPAGFNLKTMNMSMVDSDYLQISKYSALQIASAFGIKPSMINDYDKGNYANVESQQRDFYVNTLLAILRAYEDEITYKLLLDREIDEGYKFEFNANGILRADYDKQMTGLVQGVGAGIFSRDEARDQLGFPSKGGNADELFVNSANVKVDDIEKPNDTSKGGGNQ